MPSKYYFRMSPQFYIHITIYDLRPLVPSSASLQSSQAVELESWNSVLPHWSQIQASIGLHIQLLHCFSLIKPSVRTSAVLYLFLLVASSTFIHCLGLETTWWNLGSGSGCSHPRQEPFFVPWNTWTGWKSRTFLESHPASRRLLWEAAVLHNASLRTLEPTICGL